MISLLMTFLHAVNLPQQRLNLLSFLWVYHFLVLGVICLMRVTANRPDVERRSMNGRLLREEELLGLRLVLGRLFRDLLAGKLFLWRRFGGILLDLVEGAFEVLDFLLDLSNVVLNDRLFSF